MFLLMILQFEPKPNDDWERTMLFVLSMVVIVALLVIALMAIHNEGEKERKQILSILSTKGHTDIVLTRVSFALGEGDPTYEVEYTDSNGQRHKNTCKMSSKEIYWKDPI